jgi:hypothetical protein
MAAEDTTPWVRKSLGANGDAIFTSQIVGAASAKTIYAPVINFLSNSMNRARNVFIGISCLAVAGTNVDVAIYGAMESGGTKFLLLDGPVVDLTNLIGFKGADFDVNAYPAPYYYIGFTYDADNSANTIYYRVLVPHASW